MACKQKDTKRPQGRARDDVKVIITGPLKDCSDVLLMVKSSSVGEIYIARLQEGRLI